MRALHEALAALALVCFLLIGLVWIVLVNIALIVVFIPAALRWLKRNQPGTDHPRAIPRDLLPQTQ